MVQFCKSMLFSTDALHKRLTRLEFVLLMEIIFSRINL